MSTTEELQAAVAHYQIRVSEREDEAAIAADDLAAAEEKLKAARADYHKARKALEQHQRSKL